MTPTDAIVTAILGAEGCITFLYARSQDRRAARDGSLYRVSALGRPQDPRPAESAPEPAQDAVEHFAAAAPSALTTTMAAPPPGERTWTTSEVASFLNVHERTVTHWADAGLLIAAKNWRGHRVYTDGSVQARKAAMNGSAAS